MKLEKLTSEQELLMHSTREEWINNFFSIKEINKKQFEEGINWLYTDIIKKKNPKIIYCDSWLGALITISILKRASVRASVGASVGASVRASVWDSVWDSVGASVGDSVWDSVGASVRDSVGDSVGASVGDSVWDSVRASVGASVGDSVGDSVGASVGDSVWDSVRASVRDSVGDSVGASVGASVGDSVWDSVGASVGDSVRASVRASVWASVGASVWDSVWASVGASVGASVWDSVGASVRDSVWASVRASVRDSVWDSVGEYSNYLGTYSNFGFAAFYDYFEKIGILKHDKFSKYKKLIQSGAFQVYEYENIVFAIQPPVEINRNNDGILHCIDKQGVLFKDGSGYYYLNGRDMPSWIFEEYMNESYFTKFMSEKNEDVKAGIITLIKEREGNEGLLRFLNAELIDEKNIQHSDDYSENIRLYKTKESFSFLQDRFGNMNQPYCWSEIKCPSTGSVYLIDNSADFTCALEAVKFLRPSFVPEDLLYQWKSFAN